MTLKSVKQNMLRSLAVFPLLLLCACAPAEFSPKETPSSPTPTEEPSPVPTPLLSDLPDGSTVSLDGREYRYNPSSASHDAYEIDVGDGEHLFRLEAVSAGLWANEFARDLTLTFYEEGTRAVQVIETDVGVWPSYFELRVEDINFDGYMDFYYLRGQGTHNRYWSYYIWDAEAEHFAAEPYGLSELENPFFDPEQKAVVSWYRTSIWGGSQSYYRYIDDELTCVRVRGYPYKHDPESATLYVKDLVAGELKTVFEVTHNSDTEFTEEETAEYSRWGDLDYHGEEIP